MIKDILLFAISLFVVIFIVSLFFRFLVVLQQGYI